MLSAVSGGYMRQRNVPEHGPLVVVRKHGAPSRVGVVKVVCEGWETDESRPRLTKTGKQAHTKDGAPKYFKRRVYGKRLVWRKPHAQPRPEGNAEVRRYFRKADGTNWVRYVWTYVAPPLHTFLPLSEGPKAVSPRPLGYRYPFSVGEDPTYVEDHHNAGRWSQIKRDAPNPARPLAERLADPEYRIPAGRKVVIDEHGQPVMLSRKVTAQANTFAERRVVAQRNEWAESSAACSERRTGDTITRKAHCSKPQPLAHPNHKVGPPKSRKPKGGYGRNPYDTRR